MALSTTIPPESQEEVEKDDEHRDIPESEECRPIEDNDDDDDDDVDDIAIKTVVRQTI